MTGLFNIRVYALIFDENGRVLVADEHMNGHRFTKFPGGGLEFGEGIADCIRRECREELGIDVGIVRHYYTTDFFQASAFHKNRQIISVYYEVQPLVPEALSSLVLHKPLDFTNAEDESFRWVKLAPELIQEMTFPIDKHVAGLLVM